MRSRAIADQQRTISPTGKEPHLRDHVSRHRRQGSGTPTGGIEFSTVTFKVPTERRHILSSVASLTIGIAHLVGILGHRPIGVA